VRSAMLKCLAAALVVAAVLVPAAAAKSHSSARKLALMPLPKSKLGSAAAGLKITFGSGPQPTYSSEQRKLGRVTGYALIYGSLFLANPGLDEVETQVDEYKTARQAKHALPYWKKEYFSGAVTHLTQLNLTATVSSLSVPAVGDRHWAKMLTLSVPNYGSVYYVYEEFSDGKYVLDLGVAAGSQDLAMSYAAAKARVLDKRLHLGLSGRLHGHRVALPRLPHSGPPATGPDPKTAVLQTSDLSGSEIEYEGYGSFSGALSSYGLEFDPASSFDYVSQNVLVMPSTNGAGFVASYFGAEILAVVAAHAGPGNTVTPVDVGAVGDEAQAATVSISDGADTAAVVVITLHSGPVADFVLAVRENGTIDASEVQTLAQAAATRLDAAVGP